MTMGSRTLPTTIDTLEVLAALLYAELSSTIQIHGTELPASWALAKAVLIQPDGGPASVNVPELDERFVLHSYGTTPSEARAVSVAVFNALHRFEGSSATITGGKVVYVPLAQRTSGPIWNREPKTEWPRWTDIYQITIAEFAAP